MTQMPESGDLVTAFSPQSGRCFRMIHSHQLQADHPSAAGIEGSVARRQGALAVRRGVPPARAEGDQRPVEGF